MPSAPPSSPGSEVQLFRPDADLHSVVRTLAALVPPALSPSADRRRLLLSSCVVEAVRAWLTAVAALPHPGVFRELAADAMANGRRGRVPLAEAETELRSRLLSTEIPALGPHRAWSDINSSFEAYFTTVLDEVSEFARSVGTRDAWQKEPRREHEEWVEAATAAAMSNWRSALRALATSHTELLFWTDHFAAPAEFRVPDDHLPEAMRNLDRDAAGPASGLQTAGELIAALDPPPAESSPLADSLIQLAQADFQSSIIDPAEHAISSGLSLPPLCDLYVSPLCRTASSSAKARPFDYLWWRDDNRLRVDIETFLAGSLTFPAVFERPIVILGDPGAGKTVLVRGLAAAATAGAWLPIMVRLRRVPSGDSLLMQIEAAVRETLKRPVSWADLVEQTSQRTPLVLLDGFDELLQTTSTSRADYLEEISRFQESEAMAGRRVAVVVTTRTAMAHIARIPDESVMMRLEPLDRSRAQRWLFQWNDSISDYLARTSLRRLDIDAVWRHKEIACQPLLLLLLALHDAVDNEIQRVAGVMSQGDLYERLLVGFVEREMSERYPADLPEPRRRRVEQELDLLSYTSFAIFNRAIQSVSDTQLQSDLVALADPVDPPADAADVAGRLLPAQLLLGRFFFIHESLSMGSIDGSTEVRNYEFLYATFWEYLIARLIVKAALGLTRGESDGHLAGSREDDGRVLPALLSFRPLTVRGKILEFAAERFGRLPADQQQGLTAALTSQLHLCLADPMASPLQRYSPAPPDVLRRLACLSHNLVCLVAIVGSPLIDVRVLMTPGDTGVDPVARWRQLGFVWRAGMDDGTWRSAQEGLATVRIGEHQMYFGLADRLAMGDDALATVDVAERLRDAPEPLTSYEVPDVRRLLAPYSEIQRNGMLAPAANRSELAVALLELMGVDPGAGRAAPDGTVSYRDADYLDCIAAAYDVPPAGRRIFVAALAHQLEREQRNLRNRDLIRKLIQLATVAESPT